MPRIIVTTDGDELADSPAATLAERINLEDLESSHFSAHLLQRVRWALTDLQERHAPARSPQSHRPNQHRTDRAKAARAEQGQRSAKVVTTAS